MRLMLLTLLFFMNTAENFIIDFGKDKDGGDWVIVNDDVMGGRSSSKVILKEAILYFKGNLSLENNGGFASVRSPYTSIDLSKFNYVTLRFRGSNRKFALSFYTSRTWYQPSYKYEFVPQGTSWEEITIPLESFKESRVGRFTGNTMTKREMREVIQMGIILFDKKSGPFELEIDYLSFH